MVKLAPVAAYNPYEALISNLNNMYSQGARPPTVLFLQKFSLFRNIFADHALWGFVVV
jgi:hypothetical protein